MAMPSAFETQHQTRGEAWQTRPGKSPHRPNREQRPGGPSSTTAPEIEDERGVKRGEYVTAIFQPVPDLAYPAPPILPCVAEQDHSPLRAVDGGHDAHGGDGDGREVLLHLVRETHSMVASLQEQRGLVSEQKPLASTVATQASHVLT